MTDKKLRAQRLRNLTRLAHVLSVAIDDFMSNDFATVTDALTYIRAERDRKGGDSLCEYVKLCNDSLVQ